MRNEKNHHDVAEFIASLARLEEILDRNHEPFWATKIKRVKQLAEKSDGYSIELFFGLFGGMGSLNDLVLNAPSSENDRFDVERHRGYSLANALK